MLAGATRHEVLRAEKRGVRRVPERRARTDAGYGRHLRLGEFDREDLRGGTTPSA